MSLRPLQPLVLRRWRVHMMGEWPEETRTPTFATRLCWGPSLPVDWLLRLDVKLLPRLCHRAQTVRNLWRVCVPRTVRIARLKKPVTSFVV